MNDELIKSFCRSICSLGKNVLKTISPVYDIIDGTIEFISDLRKEKFKNNLFIFISDINDGTVTIEKQQEFLNKLDNDKELYDVISNIILILDSNIFDEKILIYSSIFKDYINQVISLKEMVELIEVTMQLFISDIKNLKNVDFDDDTNSSYKRLSSFGLIDIFFRNTVGTIRDKGYGYMYTSFGRKYLKYL